MARKPKMTSTWKGLKGNKWRAYNVIVEGKSYHHQSKTNAIRQYKAAQRVYKILTTKKKRRKR